MKSKTNFTKIQKPLHLSPFWAKGGGALFLDEMKHFWCGNAKFTINTGKVDKSYVGYTKKDFIKRTRPIVFEISLVDAYKKFGNPICHRGADGEVRMGFWVPLSWLLDELIKDSEDKK